MHHFSLITRDAFFHANENILNPIDIDVTWIYLLSNKFVILWTPIYFYHANNFKFKTSTK